MKTKDMILIAMFTALTAIGAFIKIPIPPVPITLQLVFVVYAGIFLGARKAMMSQLLYLMIGLIGIPIFAHGGGITYIFQPTFGYLIGFMLCATVIGFGVDRMEQVTFSGLLAWSVLGLALVYVIGVLYLYGIVNIYFGQVMTMTAALKAGLLPFVLKDLLVLVIVAWTAVRVYPRVKRLM
ncbi:biotin transporter BioY [Gottschalkiaceae bacterium SANA]|nr:biotin transporter BioY [Gottschalkiaceae bacterium SANA]